MDDYKQFGTSRDFLVLVPLLGSVLAVTYDIGSLTSVGTAFFSFFTLSEHIVFALEVLPAAIAFALCVASLAYFHKQFRMRRLATEHRWTSLFVIASGIIVAILIANWFYRMPTAFSVTTGTSAIFFFSPSKQITLSGACLGLRWRQ
jgi:hypothetical protein